MKFKQPPVNLRPVTFRNKLKAPDFHWPRVLTNEIEAVWGIRREKSACITLGSVVITFDALTDFEKINLAYVQFVQHVIDMRDLPPTQLPFLAATAMGESTIWESPLQGFRNGRWMECLRGKQDKGAVLRTKHRERINISWQKSHLMSNYIITNLQDEVVIK